MLRLEFQLILVYPYHVRCSLPESWKVVHLFCIWFNMYIDILTTLKWWGFVVFKCSWVYIHCLFATNIHQYCTGIVNFSAGNGLRRNESAGSFQTAASLSVSSQDIGVSVPSTPLKASLTRQLSELEKREDEDLYRWMQRQQVRKLAMYPCCKVQLFNSIYIFVEWKM